MSSKNKNTAILRSCIARYLEIEPEQVSFFFKGRVALSAIIRAMALAPGDEVILPAFTCVAAVNPLVYSGLKPVYADIDPRTPQQVKINS